MRVFGALLGIVCLGGVAQAFPVHGTVFEDANHDGVIAPGERPLAGVVVSDGLGFTTTAADGSYTLDMAAPGDLWVRTPLGLWTDDAAGRSFWAKVTAATTVDFPLIQAPELGGDSLDVVQVTDLHIGQSFPAASAADNARSLSFVSKLPVGVELVLATGDLAQGATADQLMAYRDMMNASGLRYRSAPGNHDWYDGGVNYRNLIGPDRYSFDAGGRHFVILNAQDPNNDLPFLDKDLAAGVPVGMPIVTLHHAPPWTEYRQALGDRGVGLEIVGHWHTNRIDTANGVEMVMTAPLAFGGLDFSPPGFRRLSFGPPAMGLVSTEFVPVANRPVAELIFPPEGARLPAGSVRVLANVYGFAGAPPRAEVRVDGGSYGPLMPSESSWARAGAVDAAPGHHVVDVRIMTDAGEVVQSHGFDAVDMAAARVPMTGAPWPQFGGGPMRAGAPAGLTPPLVPAWVYSTGGTIGVASPVVVGPLVYQGVSDLDGPASGVVCLDGATGTLRWFAHTPKGVRHSVAVADGVVVATSEDGAVIGFDALTGSEKWRHSLMGGGNGAFAYQAPLIDSGVVYAGVPLDFVALNLQDGTVKWHASPQPAASWLGSYMSPASDQGRGVVVAGFARSEEGMFGYSTVDGHRLWTKSVYLEGSSGTPSLENGIGYVTAGSGFVEAFDVMSGDQKWQRRVLPGDIWDYALNTSLAVGPDRLILADRKGEVVAIKKDGSGELWRTPIGVEISDLLPFGDGPQIGSTPVLAGQTVYVGGADGVLYALDAGSGKVVWSSFLGAPTVSTPTLSGDALFVAAIDGTVHAFTLPGRLANDDGGVASDGATGGDAGMSAGGDGCSCRTGGARGGAGGAASAGLAAVLGGLWLSRRRRLPGRARRGSRG